MKKKITALESFPGAQDELGQKVMRYEKGQTYDVPANMASLFVSAKLAKPYEAPKPAPAPTEKKSADAK